MVKVAVETAVEASSPRRTHEALALDPGLTAVSSEQLSCMAEGHDWPKLQVNRTIPKGIRYHANNDGTGQITYVCKVCGTIRVRTTLPFGVYDTNQIYSYTYPKEWKHFTATDEMTRVRIKIELSKRMYDRLVTGG